MDEQLRTLHAKGLSFSQIGSELGVSRCASIGRAHRLGLEKRARVHGQKSAGSRPKRVSLFRPRKPRPPTFYNTPEIVANPVPFLENNGCKWVVDASESLCCGADLWPERPYCAHHCRIAYGVPKRRAA